MSTAMMFRTLGEILVHNTMVRLKPALTHETLPDTWRHVKFFMELDLDFKA